MGLQEIYLCDFYIFVYNTPLCVQVCLNSQEVLCGSPRGILVRLLYICVQYALGGNYHSLGVVHNLLSSLGAVKTPISSKISKFLVRSSNDPKN